MRWRMLAAALALSSCGAPADTASGEQAWFQSSQAALPFHDGQSVSWLEHGRRELVTFRREGQRGYTITSPNGRRNGRIELLPILETPEEDYILQTTTVSEDAALYSHQFVWLRSGEYAASGYLDPRMSRAEAMRYYRAELYPQAQSHARTQPL